MSSVCLYNHLKASVSFLIKVCSKSCLKMTVSCNFQLRCQCNGQLVRAQVGHGYSDGAGEGRRGGPAVAGLSARGAADHQPGMSGRSAGRPPPGRPADHVQQLAIRSDLLASQLHPQLLHQQRNRPAAEERSVSSSLLVFNPPNETP